MPAKRPYSPWPGAREQAIAIVEEMTHNRDSEHWKKCMEFVEWWVHLKAKNLPWSNQEEVIQEAMCKILRFLPYFRFECAFKTWLYQIIAHCIIDEYRHLQLKEHIHVPLVNPITEGDSEGEGPRLVGKKTISIEEAFEKKEKMRKWVAALLEYANTSREPGRNRQIIRMVLFEERTKAETARTVGCEPGVVNYVIGEAQRYARTKLGQ